MVGEEERRLQVHPTQQPKQRDKGTGQSNVNWDFPQGNSARSSFSILELHYFLPVDPRFPKAHETSCACSTESPQPCVPWGATSWDSPCLLHRRTGRGTAPHSWAVMDFINLLWILFPYQPSRLQY